MKNLTKLNINAGKIIDKNQQKHIRGGSDWEGPGRYSCECDAPLVGAWSGTYETELRMFHAIMQYCGTIQNGSCWKE